MKKTGAAVLILLLIFLCSQIHVQAYEADEQPQNVDEIYDEQLKNSGAEELFDELPPQAQRNLEELGVESPDWRELNALSFGAVFSQIMQMLGENGQTPALAMAQVLALMLLCALADGLKLSFGEKPLGGIIGIVSTLCICGVLVYPIVEAIEKSAQVIVTASGFMLLYIPVMVGVMIAAGQAVSGASYYTLMMGAGQVVTQVSSNVLVPLLNIFLGMSIVSSISQRINLKGICGLCNKVVKWVFAFVMSVFVSVLTFQTMLGAAADTTSVRAARFAISSFVPVVGGALSDAFLTVQSCLKMLKSGIGVFAILGAAVIFLPMILECLVWLFSIHVCAAAGDVFGLTQPCALLRAASKVISTIVAILLCCMTVFIISAAIILMIGGS